MYRLSYIAYFHKLGAVCMSVCVHVFVCLCMCTACVLAGAKNTPACVYVCVSVCVCTYCMCAGMLLSSEVVTALTAIPANGQILAITPAVATKPTERLQFPPQTLGQSVKAEGGVDRQPPAILHNTLSSFHPTNT